MFEEKIQTVLQLTTLVVVWHTNTKHSKRKCPFLSTKGRRAGSWLSGFNEANTDKRALSSILSYTNSGNVMKHVLLQCSNALAAGRYRGSTPLTLAHQGTAEEAKPQLEIKAKGCVDQGWP
mmetsp:Transcript_17644/g.49218  ORF Transcript_17644/g.49218 Transcript_17644/m.49218 type:complete len:121 (-) Transcript_17644:857-1219(-)